MPELGWFAWVLIVAGLFVMAVAAPPLLAAVVVIVIAIFICRLIFD